MNTITVSEAFGNAPPRSAAVLCLKGAGGGSDLQMTEWFTWLNIKRNPMISFSLSRGSEISKRLQEGDSLILAFPPLKEAKAYKDAVHTDPAPDESVETASVGGISVPRGSEVVLRCTLAGAYNYPFKKVRIFNCNLEEALGQPEGVLLE